MIIRSDRISLEKAPLYFVLIAAFFNDWMRYMDTDITVFRITMIIAMLICMKKKMSVFLKMLFAYMAFLFLDLILSIIFALFNPYGISFSLVYFIMYAYFYFCIFAIVGITYTIYELDRKNFQQEFFGLLKVIAIIYMLILVFENVLKNYVYMLNVNDYGAYITAIFPLFLYELFKEKKVRNLVICISTYILFFVKDCKLDLLGVVLETGIIIILLLRNSKILGIKAFSGFIVASFIVVCLLVINSPLKIHEYELQGIIKEPIWRIITGTPYEMSASSTSYRTNVIIMGCQWLKRTFMVGIGAGNAAKLFRAMIPSDKIIPIWINKDAISLHNAWMEICIEFGIVGIVFLIYIIRKTIEIFRQKKWSKIQIVTMTVALSVWVWIMAPSGITTSYFIICVFAGLFIVNKSQNVHKGGKRT